MRSFCLGQIEEDLLLPYPKMAAVDHEVMRDIVPAIDSWMKAHEPETVKWDREGHLPDGVVQELRELGLFGLIIPQQYGGMGLGSMAYSRVLQQLCRYDGSVGITVAAHSSIGMKGLLLFGTDEQKALYLPKLATGELIAAFCLTEPGAGSDAASIRTRAVRDGDHFVLNGEKLWITNGGIAGFYTVFAKTATEGKGQMTAFMVRRDWPGVTTGPHEDKMGLRASSTTTVHFEDVRVPLDHVLGQVGKGFKVAMKVLNSGRVGLGGACVGGMKRGLEVVTHQAKERSQFGRPLARFGLVKQKIAQIEVDCYMSESVVNMVAGLMDQGYEEYAVEAAISKILVSEAVWRAADEALQLAGGNGYMREFPYERAIRDARINRIFEGTNEILRLFIALMAMSDSGKQLEELAGSLKGIFEHPIKGFGLLTGYARRRLGLGGKAAFARLTPEVAPHARVIEDSSRKLSALIERLLRRHGRDIIEQQFALKRVADVMIDVFALACVVSSVQTSVNTNGAQAAHDELEILRVYSGQARKRIQAAFAEIDDNDDQTIENISDRACERGRYVWDSI